MRPDASHVCFNSTTWQDSCHRTRHLHKTAFLVWSLICTSIVGAYDEFSTIRRNNDKQLGTAKPLEKGYDIMSQDIKGSSSNTLISVGSTGKDHYTTRSSSGYQHPIPNQFSNDSSTFSISNGSNSSEISR